MKKFRYTGKKMAALVLAGSDGIFYYGVGDHRVRD